MIIRMSAARLRLTYFIGVTTGFEPVLPPKEGELSAFPNCIELPLMAIGCNVMVLRQKAESPVTY
jgi:hypothetical protein